MRPRRRRRRHSRSGAALLIVLGVLVVSTTATTILLSAATNAKARRNLDQCEALAFDMLDAVEAPIQHWLAHDSGKVTLPPDVRTPAVSVLQDQWSGAGDLTVNLEITAFDQLGMVPMQVARSGSPLRLAWPANIASVIDNVELPPVSDPTPLGLDLVQAAMSSSDENWSIDLFPPSSSQPQDTMGAGVGATVATHNREPIRININTAPRALLESALRLGGRGGLQAILSARADGRSGPLDSAPLADGPGAVEANSTMPRLVTSSDCWSFRIDIAVGTLRRSWWAIYQPGPDDPTTPLTERWRCIQRLPIDQ